MKSYAEDSLQETTFSLLSSQLGYQQNSGKWAYLRAERYRELATNHFEVVDSSSYDPVFSSGISYWGVKWGSHWWRLDFSQLTTNGLFRIRAVGQTSNPFRIGATPLMEQDILDIAVNQLDARNNSGIPETRNADGSLRYGGRWLTADGTYPQGIFRDCSSNFAELQSVGFTVLGLVSLVEHQSDQFSSEELLRIHRYIQLGSDYIQHSQRSTNDPLTDGRFAHSLLVNTFDGAAWAGNIYIWHDMALGATILAKASRAMAESNPELAHGYLQAAAKACQTAASRPYHLPAERELPVRDDAYDWLLDFDKAAWSPEIPEIRTNPEDIPAGWNNRHEFSRRFYNKPDDWIEPLTLRTREKLPMLYGAALLFELTEEERYLNIALSFAESIQDRQFVDWENPIEGVYGNFYEFEGDNSTFSLESAQAGSFHMGHIDLLKVNGFIKLLQLLPEHERAADWYNVVQTFAHHYVKKAALLNPFGIHPLAVYQNPEHGGVKFFMNLLHGATGHYGQAAEHLLELGHFLNDVAFHDLATANLHFYTGLNPGIPNENEGWTAATMINMVGDSYYNTGDDGIKGGVVNGFKAGDNWTLYAIDEMTDKPDLAGWQEDWVAHSHPYVGAVARIEAPFQLRVDARTKGRAIVAKVIVRTPEEQIYHTNADGRITIRDLPANRVAEVSIYNGERVIRRNIATIGGGNTDVIADFHQEAEISLLVPDLLKIGETHGATLTVINKGSGSISGIVRVSTSGASADVQQIQVYVDVDSSSTYSFEVTAGPKVMPYLVYASLNQGPHNYCITQAGGYISSGRIMDNVPTTGN